MNIRKIIKEEIDDFDWTSGIKPEPSKMDNIKNFFFNRKKTIATFDNTYYVGGGSDILVQEDKDNYYIVNSSEHYEHIIKTYPKNLYHKENVIIQAEDISKEGKKAPNNY
jgi:hypothetical protein